MNLLYIDVFLIQIDIFKGCKVVAAIIKLRFLFEWQKIMTADLYDLGILFRNDISSPQ